MPRYERILPLIAIVVMGLGLILLVEGVDALALSVPLPNPSAGPAWGLDTVDRAGRGGAAALALDDAGTPYVAYAGPDNSGLRYAYHSGVSWITTTVDSTARVGLAVSLAIDHSERPHLAYTDALSGSLKYGRSEGSSWSVATVPLDGSVGPFVSLALDGADLPHLAYYDPTSRSLQYAHYDGLAWATSTVDRSGDAGLYVSLAVDAGGQPHLAYYDAVGQDLRYAHYDGTSWQTATVDGAGDVGRYASLALDASGRPHVGYYDTTHGALKYAHFDGTSWQVSVVSAHWGAGPCLSLALDSRGRPRIAYCDAATGGLSYADYNGKNWAGEPVVAGGQVAHAWLALDAADQPALAYEERAAGLLRYAAKASEGGFEIQFSISWLILLFLLIVVAVGTETLLLERGDEGLVAVPTSRPLRLHPASWILPVLLTLTAFLFLRLLRGLPGRAVGLAVAAVLLLVVFVAQHYTYDERPQVRSRSRLVLDILVYVIAYFLYGAIYTLKLRSLFSATSIVVLTFLLALALLYRIAPRGQTRLYAAVVGLGVGQITWPLNYWAVWGMIGGALLLGVFYVLASLVRYHLQGKLTRQVAVEFIVFGALVVGGIGLYGFLLRPQ